VTLKLMPGPEIMKPLSYGFPSLQAAGAPMMEMLRRRVEPLHVGFSDGKHFELLRRVGHHAPEVGGMLNIMLEGAKEVVAYEEKVIDEIMTKAGGKRMDDAVAQHEWDERCYEFRVREIGLGNIPGEVVVPLKDFSVFCDRLYKLMGDLKMTGAIIGIVADKNTIMFMPYYLTDFDDLMNLTSFGFNAKFNDLAFEYGGRPLGFGAFFAPNLDRIRGPGAKFQRAIKTAWDPNDVMNPGKMVGMAIRGQIKISPVLFELGMGAMAIAKRAIPSEKLVEGKIEAYEQERAMKERAEAVHQHPKKEKH
jgi:glycolate oxidase